MAFPNFRSWGAMMAISVPSFPREPGFTCKRMQLPPPHPQQLDVSGERLLWSGYRSSFTSTLKKCPLFMLTKKDHFLPKQRKIYCKERCGQVQTPKEDILDPVWLGLCSHLIASSLEVQAASEMTLLIFTFLYSCPRVIPSPWVISTKPTEYLNIGGMPHL